MKPEYEKQIANEFLSCVNDTIVRISDANGTYQPFHSALLSEEVLLWSRFERSFSTSFGQRVVERIAQIVAKANGAKQVQRQKETIVRLDDTVINAITQHEHDIRSNTNHYLEWDEIVDHINSLELSHKTTEFRVISDLWWIDSNGVENFVSLKTVKPNIDITVIAKKDCLHLKFNNPQCNVYFGLPYNPYGEDKTSYAHNPPMKVFDFHHDDVVLIGRELWDKIGGAGCYDDILRIAKEVGKCTKEKIKSVKNN